MHPVEPWSLPTHQPKSAPSSQADPAGFERLENVDEAGWRALLGRKVSLRFRLPEGDNPFSEAIGVVMGVEPGTDGARIRVMNKRGEQTVVPVDDVLAGKAFPA